jgi:hypothetical protein
MHSYTIVKRQVSDDSIRNGKERYAIEEQAVINVLSPHDRYDPELQDIVSAGLSIGRVEEIKSGKEEIGSILYLRYEDLPTLIQGISNRGFTERFRRFQKETKNLTGAVDQERYSAGRRIKLLLIDSPVDKAYQAFFQLAVMRSGKFV